MYQLKRLMYRILSKWCYVAAFFIAVLLVNQEPVIKHPSRKTPMLRRPSYPGNRYLGSNIWCLDKNVTSHQVFRNNGKNGGGFSLHRNYIRAESLDLYHCNETVTYTTHGTYPYLHHLNNVIQRWVAPVSIAVYSPGDDFENSVKSILWMRCCGNLSSLIRKYVTFHLFYDAKHPPKYVFTQTELTNMEENLHTQCEAPLSYPNITYRDEMHLLYYVNVARNIARESANSYFVLPSDIELVPSPGVVSMFLDMIARGDQPSIAEGPNPKVFVLPIFEARVSLTLDSIQGKADVFNHSRKRRIIRFHKMTCPKCQWFPKFESWLYSDLEATEMTVFHVTKRAYYPLTTWEPIFICSHDAPKYDERLTWEGRKDKMTHGLELCLLDFDFLILSNAFLIHFGIKSRGNIRGADHLHLIHAQNLLVYGTIIRELHEKHGWTDGCRGGRRPDDDSQEESPEEVSSYET